MHIATRLLVLLGLTTSLMALGCQQEEDITQYTVSKKPAVEPFSPAIPASRPAAAPIPGRLMAAIVSQSGQDWFFKLEGPRAAVDTAAESFRTFVKSIQFGADAKPTWTLPAGWRSVPSSVAQRFATLEIAGQSLNVTVNSFPRMPNQDDDTMKLLNVIRWREQVGLPAVGPDDIPKVTEQVALQKGAATLLDVTGNLRPAMGGGPFASASSSGVGPAAGMPPDDDVHRGVGGDHPAMTSPTPGPTPVFDVPLGWTAGTLTAPRRAAYKMQDGAQKAELTVIDFPAGMQMSDLVNMWRGEVQSPQLPAVEIEKLLQPIESAGAQGQYVDVAGPPESNPRTGILAAMVPIEGRQWFIKLKGDADLVAKEKPRFESFVRSMRFNSAANPFATGSTPASTERPSGQMDIGKVPASSEPPDGEATSTPAAAVPAASQPADSAPPATNAPGAAAPAPGGTQPGGVEPAAAPAPGNLGPAVPLEPEPRELRAFRLNPSH